MSNNVPVAFDWDKGNLFKNKDKHSVTNKEAEEVFFNRPINIYRDVDHSQKEERYVAFGVTDSGRRLYLVFTIRADKVRVISVRDQSRKERNIYEQGKNDSTI